MSSLSGSFCFFLHMLFVIQEINEDTKWWPTLKPTILTSQMHVKAMCVLGVNILSSDTGWFPARAKDNSLKDTSALGTQKVPLCSCIKHISRSLCLHVRFPVLQKDFVLSVKSVSSLFAVLFQNISTFCIRLQIK